jgi:hypothetical protein
MAYKADTRRARTTTALAVALAVGATIGIGDASTTQASPSISVIPTAIGSPTADGWWHHTDAGDAVSDFGFIDRSYGDRRYRDSGLAGRTPFGRRYFPLPRGFDFSGRRLRGPRAYGGWAGRRFGAPSDPHRAHRSWHRSYGGRSWARGGPGAAQFGAGERGWSLENEVFALTNNERDRAQCPYLRLDNTLGSAARDHSRDMATNRYLSHVNRYNEDPGLRMERSGYPVRYGWAENIAYGSRTAEQVMSAWMNSSTHRKNILNCGFRAIGVGLARAPDGTMFWTQNFGGR